MVAFTDKLARLKMPRRRKPAAEQPAEAPPKADAELCGEDLLTGRADQAAAALPVADRLALLRGALGRMLGSSAAGPAVTSAAASAAAGPAVASAAASRPGAGLRRGAGPDAAGPAAAGAGSLAVERRATPWGDLDMLCSEHSLDEHLGEIRLGDLNSVDMEQLGLLGATPELAQLSASGALFLDTESTGFGTGTGNYAFLVGACHLRADGRALVLEQVLLRDPEDEPSMLRWLRERIARATFIVSYNGKSFDLPLLRGRSVMCRAPTPVVRPHLDLLHTARRVHRHRSFKKSLTVLEKRALRFDRGPDISGAEVADRYLRYLHHRREETLVNVVSHNAHDVLSLVALAAMYGGPVEALAGPEAAAVAYWLWRRRSLARARRAADVALAKGTARCEALRASAFIYKVSGHKHAAIDHFELLAEMGDGEARLELAKLYEHFLKSFDKALDIARLGTSEAPAQQAHRLARLERKQALAQLSTMPLRHTPVAVFAGCRAD